MQIVYILTAAFSFSVAGYFMKLSEGFTNIIPTVVVLGPFCLGASLQMLAMRHSEMSAAYLMVLRLEAVTAVIIGSLFLNEGFTPTRLVGVLIVAVGVAILRV